MKLLGIFLYAVIFAIPVQAQNIKSTLDPFSISISSSVAQVALGDPIKIKIVLENISSKNITVPVSNYGGEQSYMISVTSESGTTIPFTEYGKALNGLPAQQFIVIRDSQKPRFLQPNEKFIVEVSLNRIYKFVTPGKFFIQAAKDINPDIANSAVVKSNVLTLTVAQDNASQQ